MPATQTALRLEQQYGVAIGALWRRVVAILSGNFASIDTSDLARAFRQFIPAAAQTLELGQQQAQVIAGAFVQQYVELETGRAYRPAAAADGIAGSDRRGRPLANAIAGVTGVVWLSLNQGRKTQDAMALGQSYLAMLGSTAVSDAAELEQAHQAERSRGLLRGWTWVAVGATCIACLAEQDGSEHPWSERLLRHPGCDCQRAPVLTGVADDVTRPTGDDLFASMTHDQQTALFKNAGAEKAELLRSGGASLADFVAKDPTSRGSVVTEAPLEAVA